MSEVTQEPHQLDPGPEASNGRAPEAGQGRSVRLTAACDVRPRRVEFAWQGWKPLGCLTLLAGSPGLGKTTVAGALVADATRGRLRGDRFGQPMTCLYATAEDALDSVLVPRLMAAGADLERVHFVTAQQDGEEDTLTLPDDSAALADRAREVGAEMMWIDPLGAFLAGSIDSHRDAAVRRALAPVARIAAELNLAAGAIVHLNKGDSTDTLKRLSGSGAFGGAPRSVMLFGTDPSDAEGETGSRRILAHAKCNVGPKMRSLSCTIEAAEITVGAASIDTSRVVLGDETDHSASDVLGAAVDEGGALGAAIEFLVAELSDGPVRSRELLQRADDEGIAEKTLRRAKDAAGIAAIRKQDGWYWRQEGAECE